LRKVDRSRILSISITFAIVLILVLIPSARALKTEIADPSPKVLGAPISFSIKITIEETELLPIQRVNLQIRNVDNATYTLSCENLPLVKENKTYFTNGGVLIVRASPEENWQYGYGYGYASWENVGYYWGYGYGYGYGYGGAVVGVGSTSITYNVTWYSLSTWPSGNYRVSADITANGNTFSKSTTVALESFSPPAGIIDNTSPAESIPTITAGTENLIVAENVNIDNLSILTNENVENVRITIQQLTACPPAVAENAPGILYRYLIIIAENIIDPWIENVRVSFRVERAWVASQGVNKDTIILFRYGPSVGWKLLSTARSGEDGTYYYYSATSPGLSVFAITSNWYDTNWRYRKKIEMDHTNVENENLSNFPVLISLSSDTDLASDAIDNGGDILFTASDGATKLSHEIENFVGDNGQLVVWVKVPTLYDNENTVIYMYYGNSAASNQENVEGVWNDNFVAVWHLKEDPSGTVPQMKDSTSNNNDGTTQGSMTSDDSVQAKIGKGLDFDGSNDRVDRSSTSSLQIADYITVEAWFKRDGTSNNGKILYKRSGETGFGIGFSPGNNKFQFGTGKTGFGSLASVSDVGTTDYVYGVGVYDNGVGRKIYLNGGLNGSDSVTNQLGSNTQTLTIGFRMGALSEEYWDGIIDEVRISNVARSSSWISTSYNNQNSPSTFYSVGSEEKVAEWQLIETWTGAVEIPRAWQLVETWTGTIRTPAAPAPPAPAPGPSAPTYGVSTSISPSYSSGLVGTRLTYAVTVRNTGNVSDTYSLTATDTAGWLPSVSPTSLSLSAGESGTVALGVNIPEDAENGAEDTITVTATSGTDITVSDSGTCVAHAEVVLPPPARFELSNLVISPAAVLAGDTVTISVVVTNVGDISGDYGVTLRIDGAIEATQIVTVDAGASETVIFTVVRTDVGTYGVEVDGLFGSFTVSAPPPTAWLVLFLAIAAIIPVVLILWKKLKKPKRRATRSK